MVRYLQDSTTGQLASLIIPYGALQVHFLAPWNGSPRDRILSGLPVQQTRGIGPAGAGRSEEEEKDPIQQEMKERYERGGLKQVRCATHLVQADDIRVLEQLERPDLPPDLQTAPAQSEMDEEAAVSMLGGPDWNLKRLARGAAAKHVCAMPNLVVDAEGEDLAAVEDLDGEVAAGGDVARVLHLAEVALAEGPPDLIPPQQRRPRALRVRPLLAVHHSQTRGREGSLV